MIPNSAKVSITRQAAGSLVSSGIPTPNSKSIVGIQSFTRSASANRTSKAVKTIGVYVSRFVSIVVQILTDLQQKMEKIGTGQTGEVFKCINPQTGKLVAIK